MFREADAMKYIIGLEEYVSYALTIAYMMLHIMENITVTSSLRSGTLFVQLNLRQEITRYKIYLRQPDLTTYLQVC